jgi:hypothetical protein
MKSLWFDYHNCLLLGKGLLDDPPRDPEKVNVVIFLSSDKPLRRRQLLCCLDGALKSHISFTVVLPLLRLLS